MTRLAAFKSRSKGQRKRRRRELLDAFYKGVDMIRRDGITRFPRTQNKSLRG